MNRILTTLVGAAALAGASPSGADTFSPPNQNTLLFQGVFYVHLLGLQVTCDGFVTLRTGPFDAAGDNLAVFHSFSLEGGLCNYGAFANLTYPITVVAPTTPAGATAQKLRIHGVRFTSPLYDCGPADIEVEWVPGPPPRMVLTSQTVGTCQFDGELTQYVGPTLTITN
ncbi:hypothetical protein [Caulobacter mirabilis]|uniref:Uncharacterized protein n=1 Tax=Caulobacter mirabilis TaxID=69666 RepID=A0A2D2AW85_9CAUL|nr:hypothetical protein [Caulobacter mirabilis]ATQ42263.1 hypothetical protein CSW64_07445 [Caulobacter mirabilis]